jgi:alanyl-tRNA synthetase
MTIPELRDKYLAFFKEKGHAIIPSAPLAPENDPSVLFTTAGMQPLVPYLKGDPHPLGKRLADAQKCIRTDDIEEVGDNRHLTFFEMLGNWSLGDYFKPEAIGWSFEFLTHERWLNVDPAKIYVSVFEGDEDAPRDEESIGIWQAQYEVKGIAASVGRAGEDEPAEGDGPRIFAYPKKKNWWPGALAKGLCGPDTEIFFDTGRPHDPAFGSMCHPNCDCGRFVEIWNNVFMQFNRPEEGAALEALPAKNVDTGMGLERTAAVISGYETVFETSSFQASFREIERISGKIYAGGDQTTVRSMRIIADHIRAATFAMGDGIYPSNVQAGYIVRRLIRRAIREGRRLGMTGSFVPDIARIVISEFGGHYRELASERERILEEMSKEESKFLQTLEKGMKELEKMIAAGTVTGEQAFILYTTYGFPLELTEEIARERGQSIDREAFSRQFSKHQELSRTASAGMFKGGLQDQSIETTRLHTATHLLHSALRKILGTHVEQKGSNITTDRLRFDFVHPQKMTPEELVAVEGLVNDAIERNLPVLVETMSPEEAKNAGALGFFGHKYGDQVKVYTIGNEETGVFSKEICGGPHVTHLGDLGRFKIQKEEASSAGIRRIKAVLEHS